MKINRWWTGAAMRGQVIAHFGRAKLVKRPRAQYELRGGTVTDVAEAREWASLFCHEAVVGPSSAPKARSAIYRSVQATNADPGRKSVALPA